jgi:pilus assembly protein CpaF
VDIRALFKATLRMRPDRIVVGEIRDAAALDLIQAMTSGHAGCLSTVHASSPRDALARLETMALMADVSLPLPALRAQLSSAIDVLVQVDRTRAGKRVISELSWVGELDHAGDYEVHGLYTRSTSEAPLTPAHDLSRKLAALGLPERACSPSTGSVP